jgi:PST family polysaccharide transporter
MPSRLQPVGSTNRRVLSNLLSLSLVQCANYLAPLITLPYLFRMLGPSYYGLVEFARALSVYFLLLTDYGFSLSATREISVHRDDHGKVSEVFSCVMFLKFLLLLLSSLILSALVFAVPKLRADWPVYFLSFGSVIGTWLFPVWLFQGLERMKYIPVLNITAKTLVVIAIFVFIQDTADYLYVPLLQSAGTILIGLAGLLMALCKFPVRFSRVSVAALKRELANGWHLFLSKMATALYTTSNIVLLGLFLADNRFAGYYAAGDKIVRAVEGLQIPLSQAIFPHVGRLAAQSRRAALRFTARVARFVSVATLATSVGLFAAAPYVARLALDGQYAPGVPVIRILSFLPFLIALSNIFGVQIMVNFGLKRLLTRILAAASVLDIVLALMLVVPLKHVGVAIASLLTETFVTTAMFVALRRRGLNVFASRAQAEAPGL